MAKRDKKDKGLLIRSLTPAQSRNAARARTLVEGGLSRSRQGRDRKFRKAILRFEGKVLNTEDPIGDILKNERSTPWSTPSIALELSADTIERYQLWQDYYHDRCRIRMVPTFFLLPYMRPWSVGHVYHASLFTRCLKAKAEKKVAYAWTDSGGRPTRRTFGQWAASTLQGLGEWMRTNFRNTMNLETRTLIPCYKLTWRVQNAVSLSNGR